MASSFLKIVIGVIFEGKPGLSPLPVEILFGASALQGAGMAVLEVLARSFEALVDMADAAFGIVVDLPLHFRDLPAIRGEVQLGPRLGPGCDTLVAFCFGDYSRSGATELLTHRS